MKVVLFEDSSYANLYPLTFTRPIFELKCGFTSLRDKVLRGFPDANAAYFVRDYLVDTFKRNAEGAPVNDLSALKGELLLVNARVLNVEKTLPSGDKEEVGMAGDVVAYVRVSEATAADAPKDSLEAFLDSVTSKLPKTEADLNLITYPWDLINFNAEAIAEDFKAIGKTGVEGTFADNAAIWGEKDLVYVAPGAEIQPFVTIDTTGGPVIVDEDAIVYPYTRIEGPACIGKKARIYGAKIREGSSIGPVCRVGGEIEESIFHAYSNKYHDGFIGHAYIGEWINLGALTTNSDLKNDYGTVQVHIGGELMDSGDTKAGCYVGDHTKTGIGTLINTGTIIGCMCNLLGGEVLPKFIPSFTMHLNGKFFKVSKKKVFATAAKAMGRRDVVFDEANAALMEYVYKLTQEERMKEIRKSRRELLTQ